MALARSLREGVLRHARFGPAAAVAAACVAPAALLAGAGAGAAAAGPSSGLLARAVRAFAASTYLDKDQVTQRVLGVVKNFDKVDPAKVRGQGGREREGGQIVPGARAAMGTAKPQDKKKKKRGARSRDGAISPVGLYIICVGVLLSSRDRGEARLRATSALTVSLSSPNLSLSQPAHHLSSLGHPCRLLCRRLGPRLPGRGGAGHGTGGGVRGGDPGRGGGQDPIDGGGHFLPGCAPPGEMKKNGE